MKKLLLLFLSFFPLLGMGQTTLQPGDIVFVAINGDTDATYSKGFSFMPLVNLEAGTEIFFTDYGWSDVAGAFINSASESAVFIKYTAPSGGVTAGTIIRNSPTSTTNFSFYFKYGATSTDYVNLVGVIASDEVIAFQGTIASPTLLFAASYVSLDVVTPSGWATNVAASGGTNGVGSALPGTGNASVVDLVDDVTALSFNQPATGNDNCAYTGPTTATDKAGWQTRIQNYSNWTFNDAIPIPAPPAGPFTVILPNSTPTDISITATSVNENVAGNTTIGTLSTTDANAGDTHTYTLVAGAGDTDNALFNISGTSLRITNSPNYETKSSYSVRIQTSDGLATYSEAFTITINDVAEPPTVTTQAVSGVLATTATGNGNITVLGEPAPTQYGVVWDANANPTVALSTKTTQGVPGGTGAFTSSIIGLTANTTYHVRAYATNTTGTSYGDDVTFTTLTNGTFTGNTSNNWATAGNWAGGSIPTSATDVTIPAGKTAEIAPGTSASCNNLTVDASGSLTIQSSSATNAGSLIVAGTATGNVTFQSYLAEAGKWHVVAAPVAAQNIWGFATLGGNSIAQSTSKRAVTEYVEGSNNWDTNYPTGDTEGNFLAGTGYSMLRSAAGVVSYTGTINTSDVSKLLTRNLYGWNALGNPYTSAINATETAHATNNLITANSASFDPSFAALYVWDAATNTYVTVNNAGTGSLVQNYIQAGQGFFIRAKDNSGLNFSITEAMQTHQPTTPLKSGETVWPNILLQAESSNKKSSTIIAFNQNMTNGLDVSYDAGMFKADKNFALYSRLVDDYGVDFAIQALPEKYNGLVIPIGIDAPAGTEITFSALAVNLPADAAVYLEDRAAKTLTQLDVANAKYTVTITDKTKGAGNFFLHTSSATTAVNQLENSLQVYTHDRAIYISGNIESTDVVSVVGIDGKLHYKNRAAKTGLLRIDASRMPAGVYLVNISGKTERVTKKVVITE